MEIIQPIIATLSPLLGKQQLKAETVYRPMAFTVQLNVDKGLLLYNTMTKALVLLSPDEAASFRTVASSLPELVELWFVVPLDYDDCLLSRQVRQVSQALSNPTNAVTHYTIFTTTDCNARCFYCYEKGSKPIPMSEDTAVRTADFIARHCGGKEVELAWFGGEPLYNKTVIGIICRRLRELGVTFYSTMTTNGYLMDAAMVREAKEEWMLRGVQITLDGTEEIYNRVKAYIYPGVNAFRTVVNNIHLMQDAEIRVKIRLNVDRHNADNLLLLADELNAEFPVKRGIRVYSNPIFGSCVKRAAIYHEQYRKEIFEKRRLLHERLKQYKLALLPSLDYGIKLNRCMADSDTSLTILPSGQIGKCEHYLDSHFIGHIDSEERDETVIQSFRQQFDELPECAHCPNYPNCIRLDLCEGAHLCYPETIDEQISDIREGMMRVYKHYLKKQKSHEI